MASPVFHGLAGAGLAYVLAGDAGRPLGASLRRTLPLMAATAILACLPDMDYLPGLWRGALNTTHQQATHSVAWVLLASAGLWLVGRARRPAGFGWRAAAFLLLAIGSHLAIDLVTADRQAPYGIPLGWPLADAPVRAPFTILPAWEKGTLAELGRWRNLRALGIELGTGLAVAAGSVWGKRCWTRRKTKL